MHTQLKAPPALDTVADYLKKFNWEELLKA
jgi:hypothetical protein